VRVNIFKVFCCVTVASMGVGRHGAWLTGDGYQRWPSNIPPQQIAFQDYVDAVTDAERRLQRVEEQILSLLPNGIYAPSLTRCSDAGIA